MRLQGVGERDLLWVLQNPVDFAGSVAFETADDLLLVFAIHGALNNVFLGSSVPGHAHPNGAIERSVCDPVAAFVEPVAVRSRDWCDAIQCGDCCLAEWLLEVVPDGY